MTRKSEWIFLGGWTISKQKENNMKTITALLVIVSGLLLWGAGGCGGAGESDIGNVGNLEFEGSFSIRDHSCTYRPVQRMAITDLGDLNFSLTVNDPGNSGALSGDIFFGYVPTGSQTLYFSDIGCGAGRITTDDEAESFQNQTNVDHRRGDIAAYCPDSASYDGVCFLSYRPN